MVWQVVGAPLAKWVIGTAATNIFRSNSAAGFGWIDQLVSSTLGRAVGRIQERTPPLVPAQPPPLGIAPQPLPQPTGPVQSLPSGEELFRDILGRRGRVPVGRPPPESPFEELLRRRPTYTPGNPTDIGQRARPVAAGARSLAALLARGSLLIGGLLYPSRTSSTDVVTREELLRRTAGQRPPRGPRRRARLRRPERDRPSPIPWPTGTPADSLPGPRTRPSGTPAPVVVPIPRIAIPTGAPRTRALPRPQSGPAPTATGGFLPSTIQFPSLRTPVPMPAPLPAPRVSQPLPSGTIGSPNRLAQFDRPTLPLTAVQTAPLLSPPPPGDNRCTCTKAPRKKRKRRTECYRGTFTETARSTTKVRKEKIPCQ